jgi:acetolactate synthase-1/2/3 large subunit
MLVEKAKLTLESLRHSERPVILIGNGVRLAQSEQKMSLLAEKLKVPILTTWKALDLFEEHDPLFIGRPGAIAQRAANFAQQRSDWFLMIGARMDMGQTAYMHQYLASEATRIMVDVDEAEINKMDTDIEIKIVAGADQFINEVLVQLDARDVESEQWSEWLDQCRSWKKAYPVMLPEYLEVTEGVSLYALIDSLSEKVQQGDLVVPGSSGACSEVTMQGFRSKKGVRVLNSEGLGPMGFGISGALGACIASGKQRTICVDGDGGFAMNTQELETVKRLGLPIKFFVLDNGGYGSIRATQKASFESRYFASSPEGGLTLPDLEKVANTYNIPFSELNSTDKLGEALDSCWSIVGPSICRVRVSPRQVTAPRVRSRQTETGSMETAPMDDLWPPID